MGKIILPVLEERVSPSAAVVHRNPYLNKTFQRKVPVHKGGRSTPTGDTHPLIIGKKFLMNLTTKTIAGKLNSAIWERNSKTLGRETVRHLGEKQQDIREKQRDTLGKMSANVKWRTSGDETSGMFVFFIDNVRHAPYNEGEIALFV